MSGWDVWTVDHHHYASSSILPTMWGKCNSGQYQIDFSRANVYIRMLHFYRMQERYSVNTVIRNHNEE